jgi:hypothetical protein
MAEATKKKGGGGRPRKLGDGATKPLSFRLAESDYLAYLAKCEAAGLSPSDFFRQCILTNRTEIIAKPQVNKDYRQLLFLYLKASNNINQLALKANSDSKAGKASEATYQEILYKLENESQIMIHDISGGISGMEVARYLVDGKKQGRDIHRDQYDERVVLRGDLDATAQLIDSIPDGREKYISVVVSFTENTHELTNDLLHAIVDRYEGFIFSACKPGEYAFFAEAHLPIEKTFVDERTGELRPRYGHIHMLIPKVNLITGGDLNPLGMVKYNERYTDAIQESINNEFGLVSPKDRRRLKYEGKAEMLGRIKGDFFEGEGRIEKFKNTVLAEILERKIENYEDYKKLLPEFGTVHTVNKGKGDREYENVTLPDGGNGGKGINLNGSKSDHYVFSREFIELPTAEKERRLIAGDREKTIAANMAKRDPERIAKNLSEWHTEKAREIKYLNSGSDKFYKQYKAASPEKKQEILFAAEKRFYIKADKKANKGKSNERHTTRSERVAGSERNAPGRTTDLSPANGRAVDHWQRYGKPPRSQAPAESINNLPTLSGVAVVHIAKHGEVLLPGHARNQLEHDGAGAAGAVRRLPGSDRGAVELVGRTSDGVLGQLGHDLRNDQLRNRDQDRTQLDGIKQNLDARRLLAELSVSYKLLPDQYKVTKAKDGSDRINVPSTKGAQALNVSDFLTKELRMSWPDAKKTLIESYGRQLSRELPIEPRQSPRQQMYAEFQEARSVKRQGQQQQLRQFDDQVTAIKQRQLGVKQEFYAKRSKVQSAHSSRPAERKAATSVLRMEKLGKEAALRAQLDQIKAERAQVREAQRRPSSEQYREYLAERAQGGDELALAELRRQKDRITPADKASETAAQIAPAEYQAVKEREPIYRAEAITYQIHRNGDVTYQRDGRDMLRDQGRAVHMLQTDEKTIETGLRLAQQKFGNKLALSGPHDFQEKAARIAADAGLKVEFTDQRLNQVMRERTAELQATKAADIEARKLAQDFIKQRGAGQGKPTPVAPAKGPQRAQEQASPTIDSKAPLTENNRYTGPVKAVDDGFVYQTHGRDTIRHERKHFNEAPKPGDQVRVTYKQGAATVKNVAQEQAKRQDLDKDNSL